MYMLCGVVAWEIARLDVCAGTVGCGLVWWGVAGLERCAVDRLKKGGG